MQPAAAARAALADDPAVVDALRRGDEAVFTELVTTYSSSLLRLAQDFVRTRSVAEEVVQETWLAMYTTAHAADEVVPRSYWVERRRQAEWLRDRLRLDAVAAGAA